MKVFKIFALCLVVVFLVSAQLVIAGKGQIKDGPIKKGQEMKNPEPARLNDGRPSAPWITKWLVPDGGYMANGGFAVSAPKDLIDDATKGKLDQATLSTYEGLLKAKEIGIDFPKKNRM